MFLDRRRYILTDKAIVIDRSIFKTDSKSEEFDFPGSKSHFPRLNSQVK